MTSVTRPIIDYVIGYLKAIALPVETQLLNSTMATVAKAQQLPQMP